MTWHVMPIDDARPHTCDGQCWCYPLEDPANPGLWIHHAHDCREARERAGHKSRGWEVVEVE